tara:strand:- start:397 stop:822 length:426 start_codon:yes stop_codon:yes gene_type:complete
MTSTVIQEVKRGTGSNISQVIYDNTTGGNVRLIIYFMKFDSKAGGHSTIFMGPDAPNDDNLMHGTGSYPNTLEFGINDNLWLGRHMTYAGFANSHNSGGSSGYMPSELMLADGYKLYLYTNSAYQNDDVACMYNILVIPEV